MKDECGVFGIFGHPDAAQLTYLGLYALQHRGQESAGIVSMDGRENFFVVKDMGLVSDIFNTDNLSYLKGKSAVGHVRYSTTGSNVASNIQPLVARTTKGKIAVAHNGNLTNAALLYTQLRETGALFQSTVDSEVILHLIAQSKMKTLMDAVVESLNQIKGAFSLVMLTESGLIAARDSLGFRPLVVGKLGNASVIASETCALDLIGARYVGEVAPGEVIEITKSGMRRTQLAKRKRTAFCVFEHVYFSRPDSIIFGDGVHTIRKAFGRVLAQEHPVDADLVMAIPDSGNSAALGYSEESHIPFEMGITRNHYVGRTFIQPSQKIRDFDVKVKLNPIASVLAKKRVIVVDDSLVRGTTAKQRVEAIRRAGATEVHLRISSPPVRFPCHFGIDTPKREKLIAAVKTINEIQAYVGADSLGYLSIEGMLGAISAYAPASFCTACFDGNYPIKVGNKGKHTFEKRKINSYA